MKEGIAIINNIIILGDPGQFLFIKIVYESERWLASKIIKMDVDTCSRGEIFSNRICKPCESGYYSLKEYSAEKNKSFIDKKDDVIDICRACPENTFCPGRDILLPKEDFYRMNDWSPLIVPCPAKSACSSQYKIYHTFFSNSFDAGSFLKYHHK